jgi:hypothetical protein
MTSSNRVLPTDVDVLARAVNHDSIAALLPRLILLVLTPLALLSALGAFLIPDAGGDFLLFLGWTHNETTPDLNHPALHLFWWPFRQLAPSTAVSVWALVSIGCYAWCAFLISRVSRFTAIEILIGTLALTGAAIALGLGQVTALLTLLLTLAWLDARSGRARAGVWLGVLCALKPFYGLFVVYHLSRKDWRTVAAAGASWLVLLVAGLLVGGPDAYQLWLDRLGSVTWHAHVFNGSVWSIGARLFEPSTVRWAAKWTPVLVSPVLSASVTVAASGAVLVALWRSRGVERDQAYALVGLASLLLSPLGWIYYLPALMGPLAMCVRSSWWPVVALAVVPYPVLVNQEYGALGTVLVGQWAVWVIGGLFVLCLTQTGPLRRRSAVSSRGGAPRDLGRDADRAAQKLGHDPLAPQKVPIRLADRIHSVRWLRVPLRRQSFTPFGLTASERDTVAFVARPASGTPERDKPAGMFRPHDPQNLRSTRESSHPQCGHVRRAIASRQFDTATRSAPRTHAPVAAAVGAPPCHTRRSSDRATRSPVPSIGPCRTPGPPRRTARSDDARAPDVPSRSA